MKNKLLRGAVAALGMLLLILDTQTALTGAADGVDLCIRTLIPALLPFFLLSMLLTESLSGMQSKLLRPIGKLCRMSPGCEILLVIGLLGGYPSGAQAVSQASQSGQISQKEGRRLLGFCSNAGPSFLFGVIAPQFSDARTAWLLWAIHIVAAVLTGALLPGGSATPVHLRNREIMSLPETLRRSIVTLANVCGWVILFRILIAFLRRWFLWLLPSDVAVGICGILELANGCCSLQQIANEEIRFLVCAGALSFGGLCVMMQTVSAVGNLGLGLYLPGKLLQTVISITLGIVLLPCLDGDKITAVLPVIPILFILASLFVMYRKKCVAIPG